MDFEWDPPQRDINHSTNLKSAILEDRQTRLRSSPSSSDTMPSARTLRCSQPDNQPPSNSISSRPHHPEHPIPRNTEICHILRRSQSEDCSTSIPAQMPKQLALAAPPFSPLLRVKLAEALKISLSFDPRSTDDKYPSRDTLQSIPSKTLASQSFPKYPSRRHASEERYETIGIDPSTIREMFEPQSEMNPKPSSRTNNRQIWIHAIHPLL